MEVVEIGALLRAETAPSMFDTALLLKARLGVVEQVHRSRCIVRGARTRGHVLYMAHRLMRWASQPWCFGRWLRNQRWRGLREGEEFVWKFVG